MAAVHFRRSVQRREELAIGEMIEDVVDTAVRFCRQVPVDGLVQQFAAIVEQVAHDAAVEGEVDLVEADGRHRKRVYLLPEALDQRKLLVVELAIAVEDAQLDHHLNEVLDDLLGLLAVARVLFGHPVQLVQYLAAGVVYEEVGHSLGRHLAHELLLGLQGQVLRAERVHDVYG